MTAAQLSAARKLAAMAATREPGRSREAFRSACALQLWETTCPMGLALAIADGLIAAAEIRLARIARPDAWWEALQ